MPSDSRQCWTQQRYQIWSTTRRMVTGVMMVTIGKVFMGTRPAASLRWWSVAMDTVETTAIYATSFTLEMHATGSKTGTEIRCVKSNNYVRKGTMIIMVHTTSNLTGSGYLKQDTF
jgi:hypothetical protein